MATVVTPDTLAERYGAPSPWRRRSLVGVVVVLVVACGAWLGWATWEQSRPAVASGRLTFAIEADDSATARFTVDLSEDDVVATCTLRAYADDHVLVGEVSFRPDPAAGGRVEREVATSRRATSVELVGCTAPGQSRPR